MTDLRTEADVVRAMAGRTVTLEELYAASEAAGVTERDGGHEPIGRHGCDTVWRRRVRNALQTEKAKGRASRVGQGMWVIEGTRDAPRHALIVLVEGEPGPLELVLSHAVDFLRRTDGVDLCLGDPPYGLYKGVDAVERNLGYARDADMVVGGYVEVEGPYAEFTHGWIEAAAGALRPGAQLVVITGPSVARHVGNAAADSGLNEVCQIAVERQFPLRTTRRPAFGHWVVQVFCSGQLRRTDRFFAAQPEDLSDAGKQYPRDLWAAPGRVQRHGLRYRNELPIEFVDRLIRTFSAGPDNGADPWSSLVVDPFLGAGTTAVACLRRQRRFAGADLNPNALRFTIARLAHEEAHQYHHTGPVTTEAGVQTRLELP